MSIQKMNRREALKMSGMGMLGLLLPSLQGGSGGASSEPGVVEIRLVNDYAGGRWYFDPLGIFIEKGQKVRWVNTQVGGSVFAFHPSNYNHELRIPETARPFNSGDVTMMRTPYRGLNIFEWTFDVEGTYDYFSRTHEILGTVGRIVVGRPGGPAENPPGYGGREGRAVVFPRQIKAFEACPSKDIVAKKVIRFPRELNRISHPHSTTG